MTIVQIHELPGMTREQYEQAMRELNLSGPPPGSHLHAGGPMAGGWRIVEVWESEEAANTFYSSDLFQQMVRRQGFQPPRSPTTQSRPCGSKPTFSNRYSRIGYCQYHPTIFLNFTSPIPFCGTQ